ncbi:MAG: hypothetical protein R3F53_08865 [Gammaproteobacteria bacterium]
MLVVGAITVAAGYSTWQFLPKLEYLPEGNRNLVFGVILPPPGYNAWIRPPVAENMERSIKYYGPAKPALSLRLVSHQRSIISFCGNPLNHFYRR